MPDPALDSQAFFNTESSTAGAGQISNFALSNIKRLSVLLGNLSRPAARAGERAAVQRGQALKGDLEAALAGKGAQATGLGRIAASSARGATTLALTKQRSELQALLLKMATQGGLQITGQTIQAFGNQPRREGGGGVGGQILGAAGSALAFAANVFGNSGDDGGDDLSNPNTLE